MRRMRSVKAWFMVNTSALLMVLVAGCFASTCPAAQAPGYQPSKGRQAVSKTSSRQDRSKLSHSPSPVGQEPAPYDLQKHLEGMLLSGLHRLKNPTLYLPQEREWRMRMTSSSGRLARAWMSPKDSASSAHSKGSHERSNTRARVHPPGKQPCKSTSWMAQQHCFSKDEQHWDTSIPKWWLMQPL